MNIASRPGPTSGTNTHTVIPNVTQNIAAGGNAQPYNHAPNANASSNKNIRSNLMNLFPATLAVPRQMMVQARGAHSNQHVMIHLNFVGTIGQGTFGQIERATLTVHSDSSGESKNSKPDENSPLQVAVKRVLQDPRYKNRELSIMQRLNVHPNIVNFHYYYYSTTPNNRGHRGSRGASNTSGLDLFLHLVLECFPESLCELIYRYLQRESKLPTHMVKVFTYQMLKALAYLHSHQICHRDIKSSNLLVDETTLVLKVCDFGSAKEMVPGAANVSYISSRYYRAPELLFGAQLYTCAIDTWSGGCVLAEMLRQRCLFMGADSVDQLVNVIRVLGTPSLDDIASMNPLYRSYNFPKVLPCPVSLFFPQHTPSDLLDLMQAMLVFNPSLRVTPSDALRHPCFNELRDLGPNGLLPGRVRIPPHLFDPNPDPSTHPTTQQQPHSETPVGNASWTQVTDSRTWHTSSRKQSDTPSTDEKKAKKHSTSKAHETTSGDWQSRARPSFGPTDHTDTLPLGDLKSGAASGGGDGVKKSNSRRTDETGNSTKRLATDPNDKSPGTNLNNGGGPTNEDARKNPPNGPSPTTLNQSFKFGLASASSGGVSGTPEVEQLTEISR